MDLFIVGYHGSFDTMATASIQRVIQSHPDKGILALRLEPYFPGGRKTIVPLYFENFFYPDGMEYVPRRYCIEKANQKALDISDFLVCYVRRDGGNAAKLLRRAKRLGISIINLAK